MKNLNLAFCVFFVFFIGCVKELTSRQISHQEELNPEVIAAVVPDNQKYRDILVDEFKGMLERNETFLLLDVRTPEEYATGYIERAINVPYKEVKDKARTFG